MPLEIIESRRLYREIAERICAIIASGEYPPGAHLPPERELSKLMGVSRTSVREALIALEMTGVVKVRVGDGVRVLPRQPDSILRPEPPAPLQELDPELGLNEAPAAEIAPFALLEARRLVEPETAALAAVRASDKELGNIRAAYLRNVRDNARGSVSHPGDREFHIRIADASGNPVYARLIRQLIGRRYGTLFQTLQKLYTTQDMPNRSEHEHARVLEALERRDARAARAAMRDHLDSVLRIFSRPT